MKANIFTESRKNALGKFFDEARWKQVLKPEEWAKVVYVLNRGGRFEPTGGGYTGEHMKYKLEAMALFNDQKVAASKHSFTGEFFDGLPKLEEIRTFDSKEVKQNQPFKFINWKARHLATHRTISNAWLREIKSENYIWINPVDAGQRGLKDGDKVKIKSDDLETYGHVMLTEGIRPGSIGAAYNYGHSAYGSKPVIIDGKTSKGLKAYVHTPFRVQKPLEQKTGYAQGRDTGFSPNSLLKLDLHLKNTSLIDPIGGGVASLDTKVELTKA